MSTMSLWFKTLNDLYLLIRMCNWKLFHDKLISENRVLHLKMGLTGLDPVIVSHGNADTVRIKTNKAKFCH